MFQFLTRPNDPDLQGGPAALSLASSLSACLCTCKFLLCFLQSNQPLPHWPDQPALYPFLHSPSRNALLQPSRTGKENLQSERRTPEWRVMNIKSRLCIFNLLLTWPRAQGIGQTLLCLEASKHPAKSISSAAPFLSASVLLI